MTLIKHFVYSVLFADKLNAKDKQPLESYERQVAGGETLGFVGGRLYKSGRRLPWSPALLHNWTLPPWKYQCSINKQGQGSSISLSL